MIRTTSSLPRSLVRSALGLTFGLLSTLGILALAGCQTQPTLAGRRVNVFPEGRIAVVNPADVAIAPVEVVAPGVKVPSQHLRSAAQRALVRKRYSPLALAQVDGALAGSVGVEPASYSPGMLREDAVLELTVHAWDDSFWSIRKSLNVDVEVRLVEPGTGNTLWGARLPQRFDFQSLQSETASEEIMVQLACERVLDELLARLPARDAQPGARGTLN